MSSTNSAVPRKLLHKRTIEVNVYQREDGLWDLEAELIDIKDYDYPLRNGDIHKAGDPVHEMLLCITINDDYTIVDASVTYLAAPYTICDSIADSYKKLIGLNLLKGFRHDVRANLAGRHGCTHVTELTNVLPTAALQGIAARAKRIQPAGDQMKRPFPIDGCHTLRADGEVVKEFYPTWYEGPQA